MTHATIALIDLLRDCAKNLMQCESVHVKTMPSIGGNLPGSGASRVNSAMIMNTANHPYEEGIERLLRLIRLLRSGRGYSANLLAEEVGISRRTLFRDIYILQQAAVPIRYSRQDMSYTIEDSFFGPVNILSRDEAVTVMVAIRKLAPGRLAQEGEFIEGIATKLLPVLGCVHRADLELLEEFFECPLEPSGDILRVADLMATLQGAWLEAAKVEVAWACGPAGELRWSTVRPYRLIRLRGAWNLLGFVEDLAELAIVKLDRIRELRRHDEHFSRAAACDSKAFLGQAWSALPSSRNYRVRLRFSTAAAFSVEETEWHPTQTVNDCNDGSLIFQADIDGLNEIVWWILGYGDQVEVLEPRALRQLVLRRLHATIENSRQAAVTGARRTRIATSREGVVCC